MLWKIEIDDSKEDSKRLQRCCSADHVIENVLPYLGPPDFICTIVHSYIEEGDDNDDDNIEEESFDDYHDNDNNDNIEDVNVEWRTILMMIRGAWAEINTCMYMEQINRFTE